jgi:LuxR family transcriptional regulator, maltose regulon positive regulatory protein
MSRAPLHALIWSKEQRCYELYTQGRLTLRFQPADEAAWLAWLREASSFAFHSARGSLNVYQEQRPRGGAYWYAYHTSQGHTRKRYLGRTESLSLARLEEIARALVSEPEIAQALDQGMVQLSSKFSSPHLPRVLVERERLLAALDGALATRLSLLSAPAGFGKTTLLSAWVSQHRAQVAWLSLDELDNSPTRFWVALIAALRRCGKFEPSFGENVGALLQSPQPPPLSSCLLVLLSELESRESRPVPLVLVLDDYQVIEEPVIHQSLVFFLEHLPAHLHLILASRVDPDLPLSRLRVREQLTEIRMDELRFDLEEASQYLGHLLSPPLSEEEISRLVNRTGGWIAGLHLAVLTLQKREDRAAYLEAFTGSQRYLLDYVQEDILALLPESVRDFLLHTAILSLLDASACQAVTGAPTRASSQQMLLFLERANLFLIFLDEERRRYRLHDLFRETLLSVLHATQPESVPLLHRRAAAFYEAQGEWHEAIPHWFAAADFAAAARLMEQTVEQFWVRGEAATMARWVQALPEPLVREYARLVLTTAFYLLTTASNTAQEQRASVHQQVRQLMARVETLLHPQVNETNQEISATGVGSAFRPEGLEAREALDVLLYRRLRLLRAGMSLYEAIAAAEYERLRVLSQEMQEFDQDEEVIWHMLPLFCDFLLYFMVRQEGARLVPHLLEAKQRVRRSTSHFAATSIMQWLALCAVEAGQLRLAYEESLAGLDLIEQIAGYALLKGYFELVLAQVLYQWNRLEEACSRLRMLIQDAATWQNRASPLSTGYLHLMQVELARGDLSAVQQALQGFEQLEEHKGYADHWRWRPAIRAQWWLAQGQVKEASDWAAGVVFPQGTWERSLYSTFPVVVRVYFAERRFREALSLLDRWSSHLDQQANSRITITYLAQSLVALHQVGRRDQARAVAVRLFALTEPEGYLRVYLDEGEPMREALQALLSLPSQQYEVAPSTTASISRLLAAFEQEAATPESALPASRKASGASVGLTAREVEVLRLIAAGLTDAQIAEQLVISPRTVNAHLTSIYRKIAVSSRAAATRYAIEHHLA